MGTKVYTTRRSGGHSSAMRILASISILAAACGGQVGGPSDDSGTADASTTDASTGTDAFAPADAGNLTMQCKTAGGTVCTDHHWIICPKGYQPVSGTNNFECGTGGDKGWCCQPAPASACSSSGAANCLDACPACWGSKPSLACPNGKTCCEYLCD